jgi:hypothetical protein
MSGWSFNFLPHVPWALFWIAAAIGLITIAIMLYGRMRGSLMRGLGLLLLLGALANPQLAREEREGLPDVVAVVIDESDSQNLGNRRAQTEAALAAVQSQLSALGNTDIRIARTVTGTTRDTDGTRVFSALANVMADIPPDRFGGAIIISDGQVHDAPAVADLTKRLGAAKGPIHTLLTGSRKDSDRRVIIETAPRFAITGQDHTVTFRVAETPAGTAPISVTIRLPDGEQRAIDVLPNATESIVVPVARAGQNIVEISAAPRDNEITLANNRALAVIEGIRDRLRVLLVSGEPHPGERTWRNLLKADAAVDLVHFTILRPPEKQDGTPTKELSLIAFPTRELFIDKLDQFDLVIFDRYRRQSVLPSGYLANVAEYVKKGGAVLVSSGPDFADAEGLASTPLGEVLYAKPSGAMVEKGFKPLISATGKRHPVSRGLPGDSDKDPTWGRWFRVIDTTVDTGGQTLMEGPDGKPLLVLARAGEGRVAQFLSDQGWLWARGFEGGGPQVELLRRLAHWLMKEPDLEEEALLARQEGRNLVVTRRSLADTVNPVTVTTPSGVASQLPLLNATPGIFSASSPATETGLYTLTDGTFTTLAIVGNPDAREYAEVLATDAILAPIATASGGAVQWLEDGAPRIRKAGAGSLMAGSDWLALTDNKQFRVLAVRETPLFATLASLAVLLLALSAMWYREGR